MSLYNLAAARSEEQRSYMAQLEQDGICIFCPQYFDEYHREPIEDEGAHWVVTKNDYPYKGALHHLLIVPRLHVAALDELPDEAGSELIRLIRRIKQRYREPSEALVGRSGDMRLNGGSVEHFHIHFVVGNTSDPDHEPIKFKVSSRDSHEDLEVKNPPSSS